MTFGRGLKFSRPFSESCLISKDSMVQFLMLSKWRIWLPRSFGVCVRWHNTHHGWFNLEGFTKKMRAVFETHKQRSVGCWMPIIERCLNCMKKNIGLLMGDILLLLLFFDLRSSSVFKNPCIHLWSFGNVIAHFIHTWHIHLHVVCFHDVHLVKRTQISTHALLHDIL